MTSIRIGSFVFRLLLFGLVLLVFESISHCGSNPVDSGNSKNEILPLAVGNKWVYFALSTYGAIDTVTTEVIDTGKGRVKAYGVNYRFNEEPIPDFQWIYWNCPDGLVGAGGISSRDTLIVKSLMLKYPGVVGDSLLVPNVSYSDGQFYVKDTLTHFLVSTDDSITTPFGTFTGCYVYNYKESQGEDVAGFDDIFDYYVPGIGLVGEIVRTLIWNVPRDTTYRLLLSSYSIR